MIYLYKEEIDKIVAVKPQITEDKYAITLHNSFNSISNIRNYRMADSKLMGSTIRRISNGELLGISEMCQQIGFSKRNGLPLYQYQKNVNIYLASLRILAEILHDYSCTPQDLSLFLQRLYPVQVDSGFVHDFDGIPIEIELKRLSEMMDKAHDGHYASMIKRDFVDFTMFFSNILPYINFSEITNEFSLKEFEKLDLGINQSNEAFARNNEKMLQLAKSASQFLF